MLSPITSFAFAYVSGRQRIRRLSRRTERFTALAFAEALGMQQNALGASLKRGLSNSELGQNWDSSPKMPEGPDRKSLRIRALQSITEI